MASAGELEASVAAAGLWGLCLNDRAWETITHMGVFRVPLGKWRSVYGDTLEKVQRYGGVKCTCGYTDNSADLYLRKLLSLIGRDLGDADWQQESDRRNPSYRYRAWPLPNGTRSPGVQLRAELRHIGQLAPELVSAVRENALPAREWWADRGVTTPTGSTSLRWLVKENAALMEDDRVSSQDRPDKCTVAQTLPDGFLEYVIYRTRPWTWARLSTKPEHGFKRRALYAADDISVAISAYASAAMEQRWQADGVCLRQDPAQLARWYDLSTSGEGQPGESGITWLSLDYSDFNKEHGNIHMAYLNCILAETWLSGGSDQKTGCDKAAASLWLSRANCNAWLRREGQWERSWSGLWSGSRDTARDNTLFHKAYSNTASEWCAHHWGGYLSPSVVYVSGDDEDGRFYDWTSMALYAFAHEAMGFHINRIKQMVGARHHEFLQREMRGEHMTRPLASVLANVATGSWYKRDTASVTDHIDAISANLWEAHRRGCPLDLARCVAGRLLDRLVVGEGMHLEWYRFRNGKLRDAGLQHPIWAGSLGATESTPQGDYHREEVYNPDMVARASAARVAKVASVLELSPEEASRYGRALTARGYRGLYKSYHARKAREGLVAALGGRRSVKMYCSERQGASASALSGPTPLDTTPQGRELLRRVVRCTDDADRMVGINEVLARLGLDLEVVRAIGSIPEALARVPGHKWSGYTSERMDYEAEAAEGLTARAHLHGLSRLDDPLVSFLKESIRRDEQFRMLTNT